MGGRRHRLVALGLSSCVLVLLGGCPIVTDAFNPDFLASFGIPTGTSSGTVLIAFTNDSQFDAQFIAQPFDTLSATSQTVAGGPITAVVVAGQNRTFAVPCPVGYIVPGDAASGTTSSASVNVIGAGAVLTLVFTGAPLEAGSDFLCGDVIEMRLSQIGAGAAVEDFQLRVRVLPGR